MYYYVSYDMMVPRAIVAHIRQTELQKLSQHHYVYMCTCSSETIALYPGPTPCNLEEYPRPHSLKKTMTTLNSIPGPPP